MTLYVFDGATSPKRLILGAGISATEGSDFLSLSVTGSPSTGIGGLTSGSVPFSDQNGNLTQDNSNLFFDNQNKVLMLGSNLPKSGFGGTFLHIKTNAAAGTTHFSFITGGTMIPPFLTLVANRGTEILPAAILAGDVLGRINFTGYYGQSWPNSSPSKIEVTTETNWVTGSYGAHMSFFTTTTGTTSPQERFRINHDGSAWFTGTVSLGGLNVGSGVGATVGQIVLSDKIFPGDTNSWVKNYQITNLASGSTTQLFSDEAIPSGLIFILDTTNIRTAIYTVQSAAHSTQEIADPDSFYNAGTGTTGMTNIYWSPGNNRYEIQNQHIGTPRTYRILYFGF